MALEHINAAFLLLLLVKVALDHLLPSSHILPFLPGQRFTLTTLPIFALQPFWQGLFCQLNEFPTLLLLLVLDMLEVKQEQEEENKI